MFIGHLAYKDVCRGPINDIMEDGTASIGPNAAFAPGLKSQPLNVHSYLIHRPQRMECTKKEFAHSDACTQI